MRGSTVVVSQCLGEMLIGQVQYLKNVLISDFSLESFV